MIKPLDKWTKNELELLVKDSASWTSLIKKMGMVQNGHSHRRVKIVINNFSINTEHFTTVSGIRDKKYLPFELFTDNSQADNNQVRRAYRKAFPPTECAWCKLGNTYNGKPITLQIDHINGINSDHRLINMRYLCPNCHSQTDTYGAKDRARWRDGHKVRRKQNCEHLRKVDHNQIYALHLKGFNNTQISKQLGVSNSYISRIIRKRKTPQ